VRLAAPYQGRIGVVQVQNKINYGVAYVSQEQADRLGADWQAGSSLKPPPFVPPWEPKPETLPEEPEPTPDEPLIDEYPGEFEFVAPETVPAPVPAPRKATTRKAPVKKG
jgi:hypothetical protein